jgi:hypothetical protein
MEALDGFERDCFDAVVTDPPWNLGKDYGPHDDAMPDRAYVAWPAADVPRVIQAREPP